MTDETPQKPAADWYPDPSGTGQLRYWDGEQWTQQLRSADAVAEAAGSADSASSIPPAPVAPETAQAGDTAVLGGTANYGAGFAGVGAAGGPAAQSTPAAPFNGQQYGKQQHAHSGQAGFFRSLFDLSFAAERSVTTSFVKVIYVIGIVIAVLSWIGTALLLFIMGGISSAAVSAFGGSGGGGMMIFGVLALIFGWIPGFINVILLRVGLEFVTAQIRTSQHTAELVRLGRAAAEK
ncbi:DUF4282 domain-containing protein [Leucobacter sp. HY1910]